MTDMQHNEPTISKLFDLTGKRALISGASGYLGSAMARALAEAGAAVVTTSRDLDRARAAATALPSPGGAKHCGTVLDHIQADRLEEQFARVLGGARPVLGIDEFDEIAFYPREMSFLSFVHHAGRLLWRRRRAHHNIVP